MRKIDDEAVLRELLRLDEDLEFPRMAVEVDARSLMPADMVREVDINAAMDAINSRHAKRYGGSSAGLQAVIDAVGAAKGAA